MMLNGTDAGDRSPSTPVLLFGSAVAALLVAVFAIDGQSYWMDELGTWQYAGAGGLTDWFAGFLKVANSDGQLPLYHFLIFLWSHVTGLSEIGLRSLNAVLLTGAVVLVAWRSTLPRPITVAWITILLCNCFIWAYLNEARPYVMLVAGSACLVLAMARAYEARLPVGPAEMGVILPLFFTGALVSFGASPTSAPFIGGTALAIAWLVGPRSWPAMTRIGTSRLLYCLACVLVAVIVAGLVLYSMAKGATPELRNSTTIVTTLFGVLEVMGGGGFVPGRDVLRVGGIHAVAPWQWPVLGVLALAWAVGLIAALRRRHGGLAILLLTITAISMLCVVAAGHVIGFRVIGRHFAFAVPPLALAMAIGCTGTAGRDRKPFALLFALLLLASSVLFRLDPGHRKDDTAGAAGLVTAQLRGRGTVWWVGGYLVPLYFHFPTRPIGNGQGGDGAALKARDGAEWTNAIGHLPTPDLILIERPEVNDPDGQFDRYARRAGLSNKVVLRGYAAYRRP